MTPRIHAGLKVGIGLTLALLVPGIACYCYYTAADIGPARAGWPPAVILAVPLALLSATGLCIELVSPTRRPRSATACAALLLGCVGLLYVARTHLLGF